MTRMRILVAVVAVCGTLACGDDKNPTTPSATIVGQWVGKYGADSATLDNDYTFFFASDSTVGVIDGLGDESAIEAHGTWTVRGDTVFTDYTYDVGGDEYSTAGVLNKSRTQMTGTWGSGTNVSGDGAFFAKQQ